MSWDCFWTLPRAIYGEKEISDAVNAVVGSFEGVRLAPLEEWDEPDPFDIAVLLSPGFLAEHNEGAGGDDEYECGFSIDGPVDEDGAPAEGEWSVSLHSNEGDNRTAWASVATIAASVSEKLGGAYEADDL